MVTGRVIRFDETQGYGFVAPDSGGEDVFLHVNDLEIDKHLVIPGAIVEFVMESGNRGRYATSVRLADRSSNGAEPADFDVLAGSAAPQPDQALQCLSEARFRREVTEAILHGAVEVSGAEIVGIRDRIIRLAREHGWLRVQPG